ncbi:exonuclease domain-containing protein [Methyloversatilis discipulorum]|uniref:3'-5' exonuclease family protein n=1 Tax=Methyloversatilis discipulorum TaxID=1119528 RepID=UPI003AF6B733
MSVFDQPLAIVDLETTGGDPRADRVTEVGVVLIDGPQRREWSSLVNPGVTIPLSIQRFTGITDGMVAGAPRFADIAEELAALLHDRLFVAHNARFDHGFLRNEFARVGLNFAPRVLCSVKLSRALYPHFPKHGLDALMERFGLVCDARHRAIGDARLVRDFLDIVARDFPPAVIGPAMEKAGRTAAAPPGMAPGALDDVPEAPGVYLFYGAAPESTDLLPAPAELPLYIGKSRNLRSRVLAHFTGSHKGGQAARMLRETKRIDWVETAGELGALLLEAKLVKQLQPLYNKQLRAGGPAVALALRGGPGNEVAAGEAALTLVDLDRVTPRQLAGLYGPFRSRRDCLTTLRELATAWQLCPKRIGLQGYERRTAACVNVQIKRCRGVCCGREDPRQHDMRLMSALDGLRMPDWPWPDAVAVRERRPGAERGDRHWLAHWCYLGSAPEDSDDAAPLQRDARFDYDHYRILRRHLDGLPADAVETV